MVESVRIGIRGEADFSAAENAARQASERIQRELERSPIRNPVQIQQTDLEAALASIRQALKATRQEGLNFRDIQFPTGQFREAQQHLDAIKDRLEWIHQNSGPGREVLKRAEGFGYSRDRFWEWDWQQLYRDPNIARFQQQRLFGADYGVRGPGHAPPVDPPGQQGTARLGALAGLKHGLSGVGSQLVSLSGYGGAAASGQQAALVARMAGAGALSATGVGAAIGTAVAAIAGLTHGYQEHIRSLESTDALYKRLGSGDGFSGVLTQLREMGTALGVTGTEAAQLADQFSALSNETDIRATQAGALGAGEFGRGFGLQPGAAVQLFGRAQRAGMTEQREFAALLAGVIAESGMRGQSAALMQQMVDYLSNIEANLGRPATTGEAEGYAGLMRGLYGGRGAMSPQAAQNILGSLSALGTGRSEMDTGIALAAFSPLLGGDYGRARYFMAQPMSATLNETFGFGGDRTKLELLTATAQQWLPTGLSADPRLSFGVAAADMGLVPDPVIGAHWYDLGQRMNGQAGDSGAFRDWVNRLPGGSMESLELESLAPLSELFTLRGDQGAFQSRAQELANQYLAGGNVPDELAGRLRAALESGADLSALVPEMLKVTENMGTAADQHRETMADLTNTLAEVAGRFQPAVEGLTELATRAAEGADMFMDLTEGPLAELIDSAGEVAESFQAVGDKLQSVVEWLEGLLGRRADLRQRFLGEDGRFGWSDVNPFLSLFTPFGFIGSGLGQAFNWMIGPAEASTDRRGSRSAGSRSAASQSGGGAGTPRSWRNNNPGNIEGQYFGAVGNDGRFAQYATPEAGWRAMETQLLRYFDGQTTGRRLRTVRDIVGTWSPAADPGNGAAVTSAYMRRVADRLGVGLDDPLDLRGNSEQLQALMEAMATQEAGRETPYGSQLGRSAGASTGSRVGTVGGLQILDMSDPSFHYGKSASAQSQPFSGIVMHHTRADSDHDAEWYVKYGQKVDGGRGGAFGYHFYIDRDGQIIQGAPMNKRTNHINPTQDVGLSNRNALGISLIGAEGGNETPEQMAAVQQLTSALVQQLGIDPNRIYGHGEIQGNRQASEGVAAAQMTRQAAARALQAAATPAIPLNPQTALQAFSGNPLEQLAQFRAFYGSEWMPGAAPPPQTPVPIREATAPVQQQNVSAGAELNVNINTTGADGVTQTRRYNLAVGEPRVAGTPGGRVVWTQDDYV